MRKEKNGESEVDIANGRFSSFIFLMQVGDVNSHCGRSGRSKPGKHGKVGNSSDANDRAPKEKACHGVGATFERCLNGEDDVERAAVCR